MKTQIESTKCRQETTAELPQPLTKQDWEEIYYALKSKLTSHAAMGDDRWRKHLHKIIQKIGPDGRTAFESQQLSFREAIVRAVNSHAILLDALKEMVSLHSGQEYLYGLTASGAKLYRDTDTAARYAIKLAQGGTCEIPTPGCAGDKVEIGL